MSTATSAVVAGLASSGAFSVLPAASSGDGTWFDSRVIQNQFWPKALETLNMTILSSAITIVLGMALGLWLYATSPKGLSPNRAVNQVLGLIVNVGRSIPFIILMVMIVPFTRFITGSSITWQSGVVPLTVAAVPFFARLVETSISSVSQGKIEAAQMMGASKIRILRDVLVRESLPALIQSATVLTVTIIGYTAMAGAIGSGGLGQLAINNGYMRSRYDIMYICVGGILLLVMIFQLLGDFLSRMADHRRR